MRNTKNTVETDFASVYN